MNSYRTPLPQSHTREDDDLMAFRVVVWACICMGLLVLMLVLGVRSLEADSYPRENYAQNQCYPRAGDWPPHGDKC